MPRMNGIDATRRIVAEHPETVVIALTMLADDASVTAALHSGARGYLLKESGRADIARRLHLSENTVRNHVSNVFTKLHVTDRAAAVARARDAGYGTGR